MSDNPATIDHPVRVFLSCARGDDEPFMKRLHAGLAKAGFTVWFDRESLMSRGLTFHQEIKDAIRTEVDRVVYVGAPKAAMSAYVREEWQFALECDQVVVTPILRLGDYEHVSGELSLLHCEDVRDDAKYPAALAKLLAAKAVLLVLDDVWRVADAQAFDVLGPRCRAVGFAAKFWNN